MRAFAAAMAAALFSGALYGAPGAVVETGLVVTVEVQGDGPPLAGRMVFRRVDGSGGTAETANGTFPGSLRVHVPSGQWLVTAEGAGLYDPGRLVHLQPDRGTVAIRVWRTFTVTGRLQPPPNEPAPASLDARWNAAATSSEIASGQVPCVLHELRFSCSVPALPLELKLRSPSYVSHFRTVSGPKPSEVVDAGTLMLVHGASIIGVVHNGATAAVALERVKVELRPEESSDAISAVVSPSARGTFHIQGLAQGRYVLTAHHGELQSEPFMVDVRTNSETELLDEVLLLSPVDVRLQVRSAARDDESRNAESSRWSVRLRRFRESGGILETIGESPVDASGEARWKRVLPGRYVATVSSSPRSVLAQREFTVAGDGHTETIEIAATAVRGSVLLGDRGVRATLWLGGRQAIPSIEVDTADDGTFEATVPLPAGEPWPLFVESKAPRVSASLVQTPEADEATGSLRLEVRLAGTVLAGRVQTDSGSPVKRAIVNIAAVAGDGKPIQTNVDATGKFDVAGLAPGTYHVQAQDFEDRQTDRGTVELEKDSYAEITLILRPNDQLVGQVRSGTTPVRNAVISALPTDREYVLLPDATTDTGGIFRMTMPRGTKGMDFAISSSGFATKLLHVPEVAVGLTFQLDHQGGAITMDAPFIDDPAALHPVLVHRGAAIPLWALLDVAGTRTEASPRGAPNMRVMLPLVDPGTYWLCLSRIAQLQMLRNDVQRSRCASGHLAPFGRLELATGSVTTAR